MDKRTIRLGKTAWGVLRALAQNGGRGQVAFGRRYAQLSPGRAVIFSQVYHSLFAQQLLTRKGCNHPADAVLTDRGVAAYIRGSIEAVSSDGPFLDMNFADPFTDTGAGIPAPRPHKWAAEAERTSRFERRWNAMAAE